MRYFFHLVRCSLLLSTTISAFVLPEDISASQHPIILKHSRHTIRELDNRICDARTKQWVGSVDVSNDKSLFYWFFESRSKLETAPIILWMNGGPGGSSMMGLFTESGPCILNPDNSSTTFNPSSWAEEAHVVYLDQPAGIGFSTVQNISDAPATLLAGAIDFTKFLQIFFTDVFPQYADRPLHIAGESFGGHYVPGYVDYILEQREANSSEAYNGTIQSVILINSAIDLYQYSIGKYDVLCKGPGDPIFNETICQNMLEAIPECDRLGAICRDTYGSDECSAAAKFCVDNIEVYYDREAEAGRRNPFNLHKTCPVYPLCRDVDEGFEEVYLNKPSSQKLLGYESFEFLAVNFEINGMWSAGPDVVRPTTREMTRILNEGSIDTLILNGNLDVACNTPGQIRLFEDLPWSGLKEYQSKSFEDWFWEDFDGNVIKGGQMKSVERLYFFTVDGAGHTCPGDQKGAVLAVLNDFIGDRKFG